MRTHTDGAGSPKLEHARRRSSSRRCGRSSPSARSPPLRAASHLTQPAVSRQVSLLERQLGTQLVRRTQRGVHADGGRPAAGRPRRRRARAGSRSPRRSSPSSPASAPGTSGSDRSSPRWYTSRPELAAELEAAPSRAVPPRRIRSSRTSSSTGAAAFAGLAGASSTWRSSSSTSSSHSPRPRTSSSCRSSAIPPRSAARCVTRSPAPAPCAADLAQRDVDPAHHGSAARLIDAVLARAGCDPPIAARRPRRRADRGPGVGRRRPRHHARAPPQRHHRPAQIAVVPLRPGAGPRRPGGAHARPSRSGRARRSTRSTRWHGVTPREPRCAAQQAGA